MQGRLVRDPRDPVFATSRSRCGVVPSTGLPGPRRGCENRAVDRRELDAYLDAVLIGGRERRKIVIVDCDKASPPRFEIERDRVQRALGAVIRRIEHIGSTAVPGLAARPIIDVLVTVEDPADDRALPHALEAAGYELRVREPDAIKSDGQSRGSSTSSSSWIGMSCFPLGGISGLMRRASSIAPRYSAASRMPCRW